VLIVSLFCLVPGQESQALGIELLVQSVMWTAAIGWCARLSLPSNRAGYQYISRVILPIFGTVPYLIGSVILLAGDGAGMYWIFAGMVGAILAAIMNAWILLVEILRLPRSQRGAGRRPALTNPCVALLRFRAGCGARRVLL
jgi:hypothetical protein